MSQYAVRYTQPLMGAANAAGFLVAIPGASVLVRRDGVALAGADDDTPEVFANKAKTVALANPVPTGVSPGAAGVDVLGNLSFWVEPGADYDYVVTVGASSVVVAVPTLSADLDEPLPTGAVEEAMLAFGVATQAELDALSSATTAALDTKAPATGISQEAVTGLVSDLASKATPAQVDAAVAALVDSSPGTLDTLNELAAALGDDPNFATTITDALAGKQDSTGILRKEGTRLNIEWQPA